MGHAHVVVAFLVSSCVAARVDLQLPNYTSLCATPAACAGARAYMALEIINPEYVLITRTDNRRYAMLAFVHCSIECMRVEEGTSTKTITFAQYSA